MQTKASTVDLLTLPCSRARHGSCAGEVSVGVVGRITHECLCHCHQVATDMAFELQRMALFSSRVAAAPILPA